MMKNALYLLLAVAGLATAAAPEVKGDAANGAKKVAMCLGCHSIVGYQATFPEIYKVPKIAGQGAKYIISSLNAYKKGDRKHPTMRSVAGSMSDQDIADVAAFYEGQGKVEGAAVSPPANLADAPEALRTKLQICAACHGPSFNAPIDPSYPRLAGQYADYLFNALKSYKTDGHTLVGRSNVVMRGQLVQQAEGKTRYTFSDAELKQVAAFVSALPGDLKTVPQSEMHHSN
jgi:cytochrome c553